MTQKESYTLGESLPYLLNRLGVRMGNLFAKRIASLGLTVPMYRVLAALLERGDRKLNELSAATTVELSTMSRLVGQMASAGLLTRRRLPNDERTVQINLTPDGRALAEQVRAEAMQYEHVAVSVLNPGEVDKFRSSLKRIYEALDQLEEELSTPLIGQ